MAVHRQAADAAQIAGDNPHIARNNIPTFKKVLSVAFAALGYVASFALLPFPLSLIPTALITVGLLSYLGSSHPSHRHSVIIRDRFVFWQPTTWYPSTRRVWVNWNPWRAYRRPPVVRDSGPRIPVGTAGYSPRTFSAPPPVVRGEVSHHHAHRRSASSAELHSVPSRPPVGTGGVTPAAVPPSVRMPAAEQRHARPTHTPPALDARRLASRPHEVSRPVDLPTQVAQIARQRRERAASAALARRDAPPQQRQVPVLRTATSGSSFPSRGPGFSGARIRAGGGRG